MTYKPAPGATIRVQAPGRRHPVDYVVIDQAAPVDDAVRAARPSRKSPGDYFGGVHTILLDWIVPTCAACGGDCRNADDGWWICTKCGDEWDADHGPEYATR